MRPECLSPEELEKLKEAVDERKKLIQSLRGKPWPMKKKLVTLRYFIWINHSDLFCCNSKYQKYFEL